MKNILIAGAVILAVSVVGFGMYRSSFEKKTNVTMVKNEDRLKDTDNSVVMQDKDARYLAYSKSAFERAAMTKRVLFFYANWCPTCRPADADFQKNSATIPDGVTLIRVNYNDTDTDQEEKDLAKKFQVTYQHTFIQIDEQGNVIAKWNGGQTKELLSNVK